jgi:hypothetical protein
MQIYALVDLKGSGVADYAVKIVDRLSSMPNGIAWNAGSLYIASLAPYESCTLYRLDNVDEYALKTRVSCCDNALLTMECLPSLETSHGPPPCWATEPPQHTHTHHPPTHPPPYHHHHQSLLLDTRMRFQWFSTCQQVQPVHVTGWTGCRRPCCCPPLAACARQGGGPRGGAGQPAHRLLARLEVHPLWP